MEVTTLSYRLSNEENEENIERFFYRQFTSIAAGYEFTAYEHWAPIYRISIRIETILVSQKNHQTPKCIIGNEGLQYTSGT